MPNSPLNCNFLLIVSNGNVADTDNIPAKDPNKKFNTQTNELVQLKEWRQKGQWIVWE